MWCMMAVVIGSDPTVTTTMCGDETRFNDYYQQSSYNIPDILLTYINEFTPHSSNPSLLVCCHQWYQGYKLVSIDTGNVFSLQNCRFWDKALGLVLQYYDTGNMALIHSTLPSH
jgi:hypothetical protein